MHRILTPTVIALGLTLSASAQAQLSYVSQVRSVTSQVGYGTTQSGPQTLSASDFLPFDGTVVATVDYLGTPAGSQRTHQVSALLGDRITISSDFVANRPAVAGTGSIAGESLLDVVFNVASPTPFTLSGVMPAYTQAAPNIDTRSVRLTGPGVDIELEGPNAFSHVGVFAPGQYELIVDGEWNQSATRPDATPPNFNVSLVVPEPATLGAAAVAVLCVCRRRR